MSENVLNLKETDNNQEAQKAPHKLNPNSPTPRHIIKMAKVKERNLKAARGKQKLIIRKPP